MRRIIPDYVELAESASNPNQLRDAVAKVVGAFAAHVQRHLRRMLEPVWLIEGAALTSREYTCLKWFAEGKSQTDTALIMDISSRKVARDMETLRAKLGVRTINQAIAIYAAYEATRRRTHRSQQ